MLWTLPIQAPLNRHPLHFPLHRLDLIRDGHWLSLSRSLLSHGLLFWASKFFWGWEKWSKSELFALSRLILQPELTYLARQYLLLSPIILVA